MNNKNNKNNKSKEKQNFLYIKIQYVLSGNTVKIKNETKRKYF